MLKFQHKFPILTRIARVFNINTKYFLHRHFILDAISFVVIFFIVFTLHFCVTYRIPGFENEAYYLTLR